MRRTIAVADCSLLDEHAAATSILYSSRKQQSTEAAPRTATVHRGCVRLITETLVSAATSAHRTRAGAMLSPYDDVSSGTHPGRQRRKHRGAAMLRMRGRHKGVGASRVRTPGLDRSLIGSGSLRKYNEVSRASNGRIGQDEPLNLRMSTCRKKLHELRQFRDIFRDT